jgi:hypothetical protein
MGYIQERVAKIQEAETTRVFTATNHAANRSIVANRARELWDSLVGYLETMTKEFALSLPAAKSGNLRADKFNPDNLTIQTNVFPLIKLEILFSPGRIDATSRETFHGLAVPKVKQFSPIRFTLDERQQPCFTDGERWLHPEHLAEEFMESVAAFFEEASRRPVIY